MTSVSASRVTRSRRHLQGVLLALAALLAMVTVLRAQETSRTPAAERPAAPAPVPKDAVPAGDAAARPTDAPAANAAEPPAPRGPSPTRFEPTEKVRADFDVSFPIDI